VKSSATSAVPTTGTQSATSRPDRHPGGAIEGHEQRARSDGDGELSEHVRAVAAVRGEVARARVRTAWIIANAVIAPDTRNPTVDGTPPFADSAR
jgi:hypothetical protein